MKRKLIPINRPAEVGDIVENTKFRSFYVLTELALNMWKSRSMDYSHLKPHILQIVDEDSDEPLFSYPEEEGVTLLDQENVDKILMYNKIPEPEFENGSRKKKTR